MFSIGGQQRLFYNIPLIYLFCIALSEQPLNLIVNIFTYGTLQLPSVQEHLLKRQPDMWPDSLSGFMLDWISIADESVVDISDQRQHPIIYQTDCASDVVEGKCLSVTETELALLDSYETDDYKRIEVELNSGKKHLLTLQRINMNNPFMNLKLSKKVGQNGAALCLSQSL